MMHGTTNIKFKKNLPFTFVSRMVSSHLMWIFLIPMNALIFDVLEHLTIGMIEKIEYSRNILWKNISKIYTRQAMYL